MHATTQAHPAHFRGHLHMVALAALILMAASPGQAAPPDLTNGEVPGDSTTTNLGATGMRGWVYHVGARSDESRQILVTAVAAGSPADGILAANDVILGADDSGAAPVNFASDARRALADAINDAEAQNPAALQLIRWRDGVTSTVTLTLRNMGAYSPTAPYNCPKSSKILDEGLAYVMGTDVFGQPVSQETAGRYSFGTLSLLAADNPLDPANAARMARAEAEALALIPDAATMVRMMSDERDTSSTWQRGHTLIVLAEYYLVTGDTRVLPAVEAYAVNVAKNQSLFGTVGHIYAEKNKDGSNNGPMGGQYGPVNSSGMPCFLGVLLARQCGLTNPDTIAELDASIERTSRFFAYYAGRGVIPYGEHTPGISGHENNGKSGLATLCFELQSNRVTEGQFYARMATASTAEREIGHTGAFFNYLWAPLGAAAGGEEAAASYFRRARWHYDLARRWDGGFDYDCFGEGPKNGAQYNDFRMSTAALLTYALPLRQLHITGRGHDPLRDLTTTEVAEAAAGDGYDATTRGTSELVTDLGSWSPMVQRRAAEQLATRSIDSTLLAQITELATDPASHSRIGACHTLGKISNSTTANTRAATLAGLLTDPENHVRFIAAEAMRYLPQTAKMTQLNAVLSAAASTAAPLLPFDEEDPLHFAHGRLAMLLFYSGNAYGPKGMIWGTGINGVDRNLLYPAIRAVAANPVGQARSTLDQTYQNLTAADVDALAGTLVESIHFRAPSDKMFSAGIRNGGLKALEKYANADGVPLALAYMIDDGRTDAYTAGLGVLQKYAGGCTTVAPDPDVTGFCNALLSGAQAAAAQAVLDAIAADPNPAPLTPFKSIQSVTADASSLALPANQTVLHTSATDLAEGSLVYTWRKVHGAGNVSFTPNGTAVAKDCTIVFDNTPGQYLFEVTVSDSRGFTEIYGTVPFTLYDIGGTLPANNPPTAIPQAVTTNPATVKPITLTGTDPEGYPLVFSITGQPAHGFLAGTAPDVSYVSDAGYLGPDSVTFEVMDSEGQTSTATVSIDVSASGVELYAYEPFDYPNGPLAGQGGGTGMSGTWADGPETPGKAYVHDETTALTPVDTGAGSLSWDGIVDNLPTSPATGARYVGLSSTDVDKWEAHRPLAQSAGTMAASNENVLWVSAVSHYKSGGYGAHFGLALATNSFANRSQNLSTSATYGGSTAGNGIGVGGAFNNDFITPVVYNGGNQTARTTAGAGQLSTSVDNVVVLKFVFGETDKVYACRFLETDIIDESIFTTNAVSASGAVDENTLNILTFSGVRGAHAIDEIRIGNSLAAVIGVEGAPPDTTPPTLAASSIVDDRAGEPVIQNTPVTYSVTFSEEMDPATVDATDFSNAGSAAITIDSIIHPLPGVFVIQVTPVTTGSLQLQVKAAAGITDSAGNPLDTALAIADDTVITVNPLIVTVPAVTGLPQATAEASITSAGLAVGVITSQYHATVPAGNIISQSPAAGTNASLGVSVDLIVSLGPSDGSDFPLADIPVSGTFTGSQADTQLSDDVYQTLTEERTGGKPGNRVSFLEHKWLFEVVGGATVTFHVEAYHTSNSENDQFTFAYSTTGADGAYQDMLTVTKTADDHISQTFVMPTGISGTVHVRVIDTDRTPGNGSQDTLFIDRMYFLSESGPVPDYEAWQAQYAGVDLTNRAADFDSDGVNNGEERLWGLDPTRASPVTPILEAPGPAGTFRYTRRDPARTGATYSIWTSPSLRPDSWTEDTDASQVAGDPDADHVETVTVTLSPGRLGGARLFLRVRVTE